MTSVDTIKDRTIQEAGVCVVVCIHTNTQLKIGPMDRTGHVTLGVKCLLGILEPY